MKPYCTYCLTRDVTVIDVEAAHQVVDVVPSWGASLVRSTDVPATAEVECNRCGRSSSVNV